MRDLLTIALFGLILFFCVALALGFGPFARDSRDEGASVSVDAILSFEDCEAAGLPVMESYPRQCRTPDGRLYTEEIIVQPTYENASSDLIVVEMPYPGAVVGREFGLRGSARGYWYFEASFPLQVLDQAGNILVSTYATAEGDWMTTEFVPFDTTIAIPGDYIGPATLVLHRDNPSDLRENDASISFPIVVEY